MESAPRLRSARRPVAPGGVGSPDGVWGVTGVMSKGILPDGPDERRRRRRLYALRAMDRLGLLGEGNLVPTLARRPALRWLADEWGARWGVLAELGRIGEPGAFEAAVGWALENRPRPEQVKAYVCRIRSGVIPSAGAGRVGGRSVEERKVLSAPRSRRAHGKRERRLC